MGGVPWSPQLQLLRDTIELWATLVRRKKQVRVSVKRIQRFSRKVPLVRNALTCSLQEATNHRHAACKEHKAARETEAQKTCENFQGTLAKAIASKKGADVETEANNLRRMEKQRRQARNVKRMRGKMRGKLGDGRVTKIWHADNGTQVQCDTQESMESACLTKNDCRFTQTEPPTTCAILQSSFFRLGSVTSGETSHDAAGRRILLPDLWQASTGTI
jgi:hypothetical protein